MDPIVIIGSGLAGYTLAREFRKLDRATPLAILSRDGAAFYSKPMLSNALSAGKTVETLATASAAQMAEQLGVEILAGVEVEGIDPGGRTVRLDGIVRPYSRLVLALGADPVRPQLAGSAADRVLAVNDLADYGRFREALSGATRVAILGAGLIGCEFANDLTTAGHQVTVIEPAFHPLGRLVPPGVGQAVKRGLASAGVAWRLGAKPVAVEAMSSGLRVRLDAGDEVEADVVLSAIGLRPRTALAHAAGLGLNRGIAVDHHLESSIPGIYALGDCAEVEGLVLPFVMPIMHASRALARTLAGAPTPVVYPAMPIVVKTPAMPVVIVPPLPGTAGDWEVETGSEGIRALFRSGQGEIAGFALTGKATVEKNALLAALGPWLAEDARAEAWVRQAPSQRPAFASAQNFL